MVVITTPNFLKALDTLNNLVPIGTNNLVTESQLRPLTNLVPMGINNLVTESQLRPLTNLKSPRS